MQSTPANYALCLKLAMKFRHTQDAQFLSKEMISERFDLLAKTLIAACTSIHTAEEVVDIVLGAEEKMPVPATLRRHMREHGYVEQDVEDRASERIRMQLEKMRSSL